MPRAGSIKVLPQSARGLLEARDDREIRPPTGST